LSAAPEVPANAPAVEARGVEKWYGPLPAVRGIDLDLARGEFLTIFGPNGAGKSTLLRMLCGAVRPTRGTVRLAGVELGGDDDGWRGRIGLLSHQTFLYPGLSAAENLDFYARLYALPDRRTRLMDGLREVGLLERADDRVRTFSRGMQQRLALARTLLLDPHASAMLRAVLDRLKDGRRTVVLVTHNLSQGLEQADRVAVQVAGRWVSDERRGDIDASRWEREYTERVAAAV
jgi:heme exporter protein A